MHYRTETLPPVTGFDYVPSLVLVALIVVLGLQPSWMAVWTQTTADTLLAAPAFLDNIAALSGL